MISCTEFIPLYSEFFKFLEKHGVCYERDHSLVDQTKCSSLLYEEGNRPSTIS